ncbi:hypothetical protein [Massilia sp. Root335]|uniref:hypothetical protein n=1 Tax=Massilia sp. Root335 TaxID=1736517 RepID=UPI0006F519B2|nr:hypothetical protein [Massilia sp. Root335]KQV35405.1 hypothetical protein ASC93_24080 [Massilia sp. Root335]
MDDIKIARGVYFLANNRVFEQVIAFLRSFRTHNPTIPLCLIPFDSDFDRIAALKDTYSFSIFDDPALLASCDAISEKFHGRVIGAYRKLVAWEGKFETFAYIDVDTVVLDSVDFAFDHLKYGPYMASHSNIEAIRRWVWKDNVHATHLLTPPQIAYAANTGFFVSVRGLFPMKHALAKVNAALELKDCMELHCMEQPFLNYLVVTSGYSYASLLTLRLMGIAPTAKLEWWGGQEGATVDNGKLYPPGGEPIFLVHWAGIWQEASASGKSLPYQALWDFYRRPEIPADIFTTNP